MTTPQSSERPAGWNGNGAVFGVCVLLAVAVLLVFGQTLRYEFINYDDGPYVYDNTHVVKGLTLTGIVWAFTHSHAGFWHPLTWISHMLDCQIYGLNAGGHHLTNVLLHTATTILLFLVLRQMMGLRSDKSVGATATQVGLRCNKSIGATTPQVDTLWPSAFVAAVFAIHPLRVESVAWVAERKDVLSGFFFILTLWAYAQYVSCARRQVSGERRTSNIEHRTLNAEREESRITHHASRYYFLCLFSFALGLMSKPMLVTLPFVLLLLDYWPLERFTIYDLRFTIPRLLLEKLPLFLLAIAAGFIAFLTQKSDSAVSTLEGLPLGSRLANGLVSYMTYIFQMFWPDNLAVFYPFPAKEPTWEITVAGTMLLFGTILAVMFARRCPYLLVGWLWYLGMLVPVIGLVQVGLQSHADRFTYLPQIGLYLVVAWAVRDLTVSWRYRRQVLGTGAAIVVAALMLCAWKQTSYWRNSESLWTHTLACTSGNYVAHNNLGNWLAAQGQTAEAIGHYQKALEINPIYSDANNNLGLVLLNQGHLDEAIEYYHRALEGNPDSLEAHNYLGILLEKQGRTAEAVEHYQRAIEHNPDCAEIYYNLGSLLAGQGQTAEANEQFRKALAIEPDNAKIHYNLANILSAQGRWDEAIEHYQQALKQMPDSIHAHYQLGLALQSRGRFAAAVAQLHKVLELDPKHVMAQNNLAWLLATCPDNSLRNGNKAVELAQQAVQLSGGKFPEILDTLAAAYAEAGRYPEAIETAQRALDLSAAQNKKPLAEAIQTQLRFYEANSPFHEKP